MKFKMDNSVNRLTDNPMQNTISLRFSQEFTYPVCFTHDVFNTSNDILLKAIDAKNSTAAKKTLVCIDEGVIRHNTRLLDNILKWFKHYKSHMDLVAEPVIFPGGETVKNTWDHVHRTTKIMNDLSLDRHGFIIAIGGGALLDMVGFASSIFHRGIQLIRLPTTTLSQNDAGVGVKNGINEYARKNCIGTFYVPKAVINDFSFLKTLCFDHFIGGVAEAIKIALIRDASFFSFLETNGALLKERDQNSIEETIKLCARHHLDHIALSGDAFETGSSRPLDFGHWSAHKIEMLSGFSLSHGQAVSIGLALDAYYAWRKSLIKQSELDRILDLLTQCGLPVWSLYLEYKDRKGRFEIENGLEEFRQHLGGKLTFTMPDGIGQSCELHEMDFDIVRDGMLFLKKSQGHAKEGKIHTTN